MAHRKFLKVYEPVDASDIARVRSLLEPSGVIFYIQNENYFHVSGGIYSLGDTEVWVMVDSDDVDEARSLLGLDPSDT
jgi:hypothetical protein